MEKRNYIESRSNVGILPTQVMEIRKLINKKKYRSINSFVIEAVKEKLSHTEQNGKGGKDGS